MADPISCEGWDTGKPFLGVPSKFVVINEDGEEVGTLDKLIPLLMLVSNNLSDIDNAVEARNNLGVYSKDEVDDAIPDASTEVKGIVKLNNTVTSKLTNEALTARQGKFLSDQDFGVGQTFENIASSVISGTVYTNVKSRPILISVIIPATASQSASISVGGVLAASGSTSATNAQGKTISAVVPPGATYSIVYTSGITSILWLS